MRLPSPRVRSPTYSAPVDQAPAGALDSATRAGHDVRALPEDSSTMRHSSRAVIFAFVASALASALASCQRRDRDGASSGVGSAGAQTSTSSSSSGNTAAAGPEGSRRVPPLPEPLPGRRIDLTAAIGKADRAAIGDLDGDGRSEIVVADAQRLRVLDASGKERASASVPGGIQVLAVARLGESPRAAILAGWGLTREHRQATARVEVYRLEGEQLAAEAVLAPATPRNEIAAIVPLAEEPGALLVAYFDSKYTVRSVIARPGSPWRTTDIATIRMATAYARGDLDGDGRPELVVGRVYGDDKGVDGDAFVLRDGGARTSIPTTRGVRELAIADSDGDGRPELFLADGWHQDYGQLARGLLTWVRFTDGAPRAELIEDTPGQFSVGRILPADVDGDGRPELATLGSHYVRMFARRGSRWEGLTLAGAARDLAVGDLDGAPGDEVLILGDKVEIVSLRGTMR